VPEQTEHPIIEAAQKKRADLLEELKKINEFLEMYRTFEIEARMDSVNTTGTHEESTGVANPVDRPRIVDERTTEEGADAPPPRRVRVRDNPKPAAVVAAAVEVIRAHARPMTRRQVWEALKERGMVVNGTDPVKTLGTILWRSGSDQLTQLDGYGYWLKDQSYPPAGYDAEMKRVAVQTAFDEIMDEMNEERV
jgi:hypothetical protein